MLAWSWVTAAWSGGIAVCLAMAFPLVLVWLKNRSSWAYLLCATAAASAAGVGAFELLLMRAGTAERYAALMRWGHLPLMVLVVCLVWFAKLYLDAGRAWLAWTVCGARALVLALASWPSSGINYVEITRLRHVELLGERVTIAVGPQGPLHLVDKASVLLALAYFVDVTIGAWRRGDRRRAITVGGALILFTVLASVHGALFNAGLVELPWIISFSFLGLMVAMGLELSRDVLRAADYSQRLVVSEAEVRDSAQRLSLAARAAGLGFWAWEVATGELWISPEGRALHGVPLGREVTLQGFLRALPTDDRRRMQQRIEESLGGAGELHAEYRLGRRAGRTRWIAVRGAVERDAASAPLRLRGVLLDITDRRTAELETARQRDQLAHLSRVSMLGELSGSLAHELNQPLTAILSNAQAAQRQLTRQPPDLNEVRDILAEIVAEDKRAGEIIRRLRRLLTRGEVSRQPLGVSEVVNEALAIMRSDLLNHGAAVSAELADDLPAVSADRVQLQQVLLNLAVNGCDAMSAVPPGERILRLTTCRDGARAVRVSVSDRGSGIPAESLVSIFEPFVTTKAHGMGLGLTVCKTIVEAHGGRIWAANNEDGRGAAFHVTLPALEGPA